MKIPRLVAWLSFLFVFAWVPALAQDDEPWAPTPPRLSHVDGEVSHWRAGAENWTRAGLNLPLAEGDALYTGSGANLEVQFGPRSFVRADERTQLSLLRHEPRRIQFQVSGGRASFDLRGINVGDTLEVSTPHAVFLIESAGYYRVEVNDRDTHIITRRGGEATLTTADGRTLSVYPSEEIVIVGGTPAKVATYAAPAPDAWDRWNDARSDRLGESISARYLPPDVYGAEELDHYGHWRVVPTYGPVWIPFGVSATWVPYSTGYWIWDPYYAWTWIDDAPWGWAPFHYGRWVYIDGFWAWAPGPVVRRAVYSPALVAFMVRDGNVSLRLSVGVPGVWWVALSWGEPVLPWWGPPERRWHPWWGGWGGPRIVNNVVVQQTTVVNVTNIVYRNTTVPRAVLTVPHDKFGRERVQAMVETRLRPNELAPARSDLPIRPTRVSLTGGAPKGIEPPRELVARPVVSTRAPREVRPALEDGAPRVRTQAIPESRVVVPPVRQADPRRMPERPPFGEEGGPERAPAPRPPRYEDIRRVPEPMPPSREPATVRTTPAVRQPAPREPVRAMPEPLLQRERPGAPQVAPPREPRPAPQREEIRREEREEIRREERVRPLPGQPANQIFRGRERDNRGEGPPGR
ncbi:MAG: DUF6600 domain-containing protein [Thiobacillus sp.]